MSMPLFHRGHYNVIAARINEQYLNHGSRDMDPYRFANNTLDELVLAFCETFVKDNSEFDAAYFIKAAVPEHRLKKLRDDIEHSEF